MTQQITRKGSGRTAGSFSFVQIPLSALVAKFADVGTSMVVSRKWAEAVGFEGLASKSAKDTFAVISAAPVAPEVPVQVSVIEPE
jgi:hypothetical protein